MTVTSMTGLVGGPRPYRYGVAVMSQGRTHYVVARAAQVLQLMTDLPTLFSSTSEQPPNARSVLHYEFECICPFEDGNGCMGRIWQTLVLTRWALHTHVSLKSVAHAQQSSHCLANRQSSTEGQRTAFVAFMLYMTLETLSPTNAGTRGRAST